MEQCWICVCTACCGKVRGLSLEVVCIQMYLLLRTFSKVRAGPGAVALHMLAACFLRYVWVPVVSILMKGGIGR